jgi:hypothetical protein
MAWKKSLIVLTLLFSGCVTNVRKIDVCVVDVFSNHADCARNDKKYEKKLEDLSGWSAFSDVDFELIANRLAECSTVGKLPREDIFSKVETCEIYFETKTALCNNIIKDIEYVDGFIATDESGLNKIKSRFDFCMRDSK